MKRPGGTGEAAAAKALGHRFTMKSFGAGFVRGSAGAEDTTAAAKAMAEAREIAERRPVDVLVLDEVLVALKIGLVTRRDIEYITGACAGRIELVLTGRGAPAWLRPRADYWTELREVKHPFARGVKARRGIEY
jgi:cob(I)alamin adenosyltransferase